MWQSAIYLFFVTCFLLSCEEEKPIIVKAISYPELEADTTAIDSTYGPDLNIPFDWMVKADSHLQQKWLEQQVSLTQSQLQKRPFSKNWSASRITNFPQQIKDTYFALGYQAGQQALLQGDDLSTISSYQAIFKANRLPEGYFIEDFLVNDSKDVCYFLLGQDTTEYFTPAVWNTKNDSINIWSTLRTTKDWLIDSANHTMLFHDSQRQTFHQIDLNTNQFTSFTNPFSPNDKITLCGLLPKSEYLIKRESRNAPVQYWSVYQNIWIKLFDLSADPYQWLGQQSGQFYFSSDFQSDFGSLFTIEGSINGNQINTLIEAEDMPIIDAVVADSIIWTLQEWPGKTCVKKWSLEGGLLKTFWLPEAILALDMKYYPGSGTLLVRQVSPTDGVKWLAINEQYRQEIEPVYSSLKPKAQLRLTTDWQYIKSYDGTELPILIIRRADAVKINKTASLIIPIPNQGKDLIQGQPDLAFINRFLTENGLLVIVFPRGNRRLGKNWYEQGTGSRLQLAYDDLQATLAYCNQKQIGQADKRAIWATKEQALSTAALVVQRPDLVDAVYLQKGIYDFRMDLAGTESLLSSDWWIYQAAIPPRLIQQYVPYFYPMDANNSPKILVQSDKPYIFDISTAFLIRLQQEAPIQEKLWSPYHQQSWKRDDDKRMEWEAMMNAFFLN
jgi:hypothetical protein